MDMVPEDGEYSATHKQSFRDRTFSLNSMPQTSSVNFRNARALRPRSSIASSKSITCVYSICSRALLILPFHRICSSDTEPAEIVSPVPRRHLSHASESLSWLKADTFSDVDSQARCVSPLSAASSTPSVFPSSSSRRLSFSVLLEQERQARTTALRRTQTEDTTDQGAVRRWVRWMHKHNMKSWVVPCAITASAYVKWCIGLGRYSGMFLAYVLHHWPY